MEFPLVLNVEKELHIKEDLLKINFIKFRNFSDEKKCKACLLYWYLRYDMTKDNILVNIIDINERDSIARRISDIDSNFESSKDMYDEIALYKESLEYLLDTKYELLHSYNVTIQKIGQQLKNLKPTIHKTTKEIGVSFSSNIPIMVNILKQIPAILINKLTLQENLGDITLNVDLRSFKETKKRPIITEVSTLLAEEQDEI